MLGDGIQRAVLVIGRAAELYLSRAFLADLGFQLLHEPRFPDARLTAQQHDLACPGLGLYPALVYKRQLLCSADQRGQAAADGRLKAVLRFPLRNHSIQGLWRGNPFQLMASLVCGLEQPGHQPLGGGTDNDVVRLSLALHPGGNIGRLA